ncbi:hypothetical protein ACFX2J_022991 [Malus domestica]
MVVKSLVQSSADAEGGADAADPHSKSDIPSPPGRRTSSRLRGKEKPQKEILVRKRVALLDEHRDGDGDREQDGGGDGGSLSKRANVDGGKSSHAKNEAGDAGSNGCLEGGASKPTDSSAEKSDHAKVKETLRLFNKHYLYFVQEEEMRCRKVEADKKASKSAKKGSKSSKKSKKEASPLEAKASKRHDLKAISKASEHDSCLITMMERKEILNAPKRIGSIPGIDVGHQFYSRAEMVAVGFHSHWLNGIDFMGQNYDKVKGVIHTFPLWT